MEKIVYPTMDALSYARLRSVNSGYNLQDYDNFGYQATDIPIPMPTECPCCNKTMSSDLTPIIAVNNLLPSDFVEDDERNFKIGSECNTASIYRCTSCNSLFSIWSKHKAELNENQEVEWSCEIENMYPFDTYVTCFSDEISELSSEFISIYNQSELAEAQNLDKICGMGYRRALEFLVDAYIKHKENVNVIPERNLQQKIQNHIDNDAVRVLAEKATWLGNDTVHIENKHPDRTITDMKNFIMQICKWIDFELSVEDANTIERN